MLLHGDRYVGGSGFLGALVGGRISSIAYLSYILFTSTPPFTTHGEYTLMSDWPSLLVLFLRGRL